MTLSTNSIGIRPMVLRLSTAAELMRRNPLSFDKNTTIQKATELLELHKLEAAPVVDEYGRLAGMVSMNACTAWQEYCVRSSPHRSVDEGLDPTTVDEIMRPVVEIVHEHASSRDVIEKLLEQRPRRVYIVNDEEQLVGVVSTADVLRHLLASDLRQACGAGASSLC